MIRGLTVALLTMTVVAGCSPEREVVTTGEANGSFAQLARAVLTSARADPAVSEAQITLLQRAQKAGGVTVSDMREAMEAENACLVAAGLSTPGVSVDDSTIPASVTVAYIRGPAGMSQKVLSDLVDVCDHSEADALSLLYSQQPSVQDQYWTEASKQMARIRACLVDHGVPPSDVGDDVKAVIDTAVTLTIGDPNLNPYGYYDCLSPLSMPLWN